MATYVLLMRWHSDGFRDIYRDPDHLLRAHEALARWEAKVIESVHVLGEWDQCTIFEAPDNFHAYRATLAQELGTTGETEILPAIDLPLFQRLLSQSAETEGPHLWQVRWWATLARAVWRTWDYARWRRAYFTEYTVIGKEKLDRVNGPCIVIANHASHLDQYALLGALPLQMATNLYIGAAADRWFLKGRKELTLQPWFQSMMGLYPVHRGGGSAALDYPKWLLQQGKNIMLFPEGTRARGSALSKFKHGVSILALETGVPVVPVYMEGLQALRPPGTKTVTPGPVTCHVLDPIRFAPGTEVPAATKQLFEAMNAVHVAARARRRGSREDDGDAIAAPA